MTNKTNKLMKLSKWVSREFTNGSEPCGTTLKNWIEKGEIDGIKIGGQYYIRESFTLDQSEADSQISAVVTELMKLSA